jgi:hypothetical protein
MLPVKTPFQLAILHTFEKIACLPCEPLVIPFTPGKLTSPSTHRCAPVDVTIEVARLFGAVVLKDCQIRIFQLAVLFDGIARILRIPVGNE